MLFYCSVKPEFFIFCHQVVERLLGLPVEYWSQFMISENEQGHKDHMVFENANVHATPDHKSMNFTSKALNVTWSSLLIIHL